jgi:outer membrane immunogenic protein
MQEASASPPEGQTPAPKKQTPVQSYDDSRSAQSYTPVATPPVVPARNFSGGYLGVVAGAVWQRSEPYLDCYDFTNSNPNECSTRVSFAVPPNVFNLNDAGFLGGGQVGYNFAVGNVVFGVEADIAYTDVEATSTYVVPLTCCTRDTTLHQELSSLSTVRGRLGYAFDNVLLYVTGGLAVGQVDYSFRLTDPSLVGGGFASDSESKLAVGYAGGAGIELSLGKWSLKTEYLFYDLGEETLTAPFRIGGATEPFTFRPEFDTQGHIVRVGTNFHLN